MVFLNKCVVVCLDETVVACLDEDVVACLDKDNMNNFDVGVRKKLMTVLDVFSSHIPWNIFLRVPWVENLYSTMVILSKVVGLIHIFTSIMTTNR